MIVRMKFRVIAVFMMLMWHLGALAWASAPAGELIVNQATGTFLSASPISARNILSNTSLIIVAKQYDFTLAPVDQNTRVFAGQQAHLTYTLTNTGNIADRYRLLTENPFTENFDYQNIVIYHDKNGNSRIDPEDEQIALTPELASGESISLLVIGGVPEWPPPQATGDLKMTATSVSDDTLIQTHTKQRTLSAPISPEIVFKDHEGNTADIYRLDQFSGHGYDCDKDGVYISVTASALNEHTWIEDRHQIILQSAATLDILYIWVQETGPDTGLFRSVEKVCLKNDTAAGGSVCVMQGDDCVLNGAVNDTLTARAWVNDAFVSDTAQVSGPFLEILKSNTPTQEQSLFPGEAIRYTVTATNTGDLAVPVREVVIDRVSEQGVLIEDDLAADLLLDMTSPPVFTPADARILVKQNGTWQTPISGIYAVESVGLFLPPDRLAPGQAASFTFTAGISDTAAPGETILNTAGVDIDGDGLINFSGNTVANQLHTGNVVMFMRPNDALQSATPFIPPDFQNDADYKRATRYITEYDDYDCRKDGAYIQVQGSGLNVLPETAETHDVTLTSRDTGDLLYVRVYETGPNTGVFRSLLPVCVSTYHAGNQGVCRDSPDTCFIKSADNDLLSVQINDPFTQGPVVDQAVVVGRGHAGLSIQKTVNPACDELIFPGSVIAYTLTIGNTGDAEPAPTSVVIGTETQWGLVVSDPIPANAHFMPEDDTVSASVPCAPLVKLSGGAANSWTPQSAYTGDGKDIVEKGLFIPVSALLPEETVTFGFRVRVAENAAPGTVITNTAFMDTDGDGAFDIASNETCSALDASVVGLRLVAEPPCVTTLATNSIITYKLTFQNTGSGFPKARTLTVDGQTMTGVLMESEIPPNTHLETIQPTAQTPATGKIIFQSPTDSDHVWRGLERYNGVETVKKIGFLVSAQEMPSGMQGEFTLMLRVVDTTTPGTVISNRFYVDRDGDGAGDIFSNKTQNQVGKSISDETLQIRFRRPNNVLWKSGNAPDYRNDADYATEDVTLYRMYRTNSPFVYNLNRHGFYVEILSTNRNLHSYAADEVGVHIKSHKTGTEVHTQAMETGPNTGVFRVVNPIKLSDDTSGCSGIEANCLVVNEDDSIEMSFDEIWYELVCDRPDVSVQKTIKAQVTVDPLGVVFNSISLKPVTGAEVSIRHFDGSAEDQLAFDPIVDDGVTRLPVQTTGADGFYQYPHNYPNTSYYIGVTPPAGYTFPSIKCPGDVTSRRVGAQSYGKNGNGLCGLGNGDFVLLNPVDILIADIPLDPVSTPLSGTVFDNASQTPLSGAEVVLWLYDPDTGQATQADRRTTDANGEYTLPIYWEAQYYVTVNPPSGYRFPSQTPPSGFTHLPVTAMSYGKNGFGGQSGIFSMATPTATFSPAHIPLDPGPENPQQIAIEKKVSSDRVEVGDVVRYEVRIKNNSGRILTDAVIHDQLPFGMKYEPGSCRVNGEKYKDPDGGRGPLLAFKIGLFPVDQEIVLTYVVRVTPGVLDGDGINAATALAFYYGNAYSSATARIKVDVVEQALFSDQAILFGKIFLDSDCNNIQNDGEWPIGGVRLFLEDGSWAVTDEHGQYVIYGLKPGYHTLKVDTLTLPKDAVLKPLDNRHSDDAGARFVDLVAGEFHRADFAIFCFVTNGARGIDEIRKRNENSNGEWMLEQALTFNGAGSPGESENRDKAPVSPDGDISSGVSRVAPLASLAPERSTGQCPAGAVTGILPADSGFEETEPGLMGQSPTSKIPDPEKIAADITGEMAKKGTWLWPKEDISRYGRFMVVTPAGIEPRLTINDEPVSKNKMGARIENRAAGAQVAAWYGVTLTPGENKVVAHGRDVFGNHRVLAEKTVFYPGPLSALDLKAESDRLDADGGRSLLKINIRLTDNNGVPVTGVHFVTLETTLGTWHGEDIQPTEAGHQTRVSNGERHVFLRSSNKTGKARVRASLDRVLSDEIEVRFARPLRPLVAAGIADFNARLSFSGRSYPSDSFDHELTDRIFAKKRAAFFLKGKTRFDSLLTVAYDTEKDDDTTLLRDLDFNDYYPIYGDASSKGYDAQSRSRLFVRLEKDKNSLMWGDFSTDHGADESLGRFQRVLTGVNARFENDYGELSVFGAQTDYDRKMEIFRGNGTAMFYRLSGAPIVAHSETVEMLVKDKNNDDLVIERRTLQRFEDYLLDEFSGYLHFFSAVARSDPDGNSIYIRVSYDVESADAHYFVGGARLSAPLGDHWTVGGGYTEDRHPEDGYGLASAFVRYQWGKDHQITLETGRFYERDVTAPGDAVRLKWESRFQNGANIKLTGYEASSKFKPKDSLVSPGRRELKAEVSYPLDAKTQIKAEGDVSSALDTDQETVGIGLFLSKTMGAWRAEAGARRNIQKGIVDDETFNTGRLRLERQFKWRNRVGSGFGEWEQDITETGRRTLSAGGEYFVHDRTKMYFKHELSNSLSRARALSRDISQVDTTLGFSSTYFNEVETYVEHRMRGAMDDREKEMVTGVKKRWELAPNLSISPQIEYSRVSDQNDADHAFSLSLGFLDTRFKTLKTSIRTEIRTTSDSAYLAFLGNTALRLNPDWSLLIKEDLAYEALDNADDSARHTLTVGVARRPLLQNRYHLLGMYQWKFEKGQGDSAERSAHLAVAHQNYQINDDWILSGRLAGKWVWSQLYGDAYRSAVQLAGARLIWDITSDLDFDLHGGALSLDFGESVRYSLGGESISGSQKTGG